MATKKPKRPDTTSMAHDETIGGEKVLKLFISYAREDFAIATAVSNALNSTLNKAFAQVFMDKTSLEMGDIFPTELQDALDATNVLIVIYSGVERPSVSYPGFEVGYFTALQKREKKRGGAQRIVVPLYLDTPPDVLHTTHGFGFGISKAALKGEEQAFLASLALDVTDAHPAVRFLKQLQDLTGRTNSENLHYLQFLHEHAKARVVDMMTAIYRHLKSSVYETQRPQKRITIRTTSAALEDSDDLPANARIEPDGAGGAMGIFGLMEGGVSWEEFVLNIARHRFATSWRDAIATVVHSSVQPTANIDNHQIIVSYDEKSTYRLILTADKCYYDGRRDFSLYFVETIRPRDFGDQNTTRLLKGLEIVCRFRFMFLEQNSQFGPQPLSLMAEDKVPSTVRNLLHELNLLQRDAQFAGLEEVSVWGELIDWDLIREMGETWVPLETRLRPLCSEIIEAGRIKAEPKVVKSLATQLASLLTEICETIRPINTKLIKQMTSKLGKVVNKDAVANSADR